MPQTVEKSGPVITQTNNLEDEIELIDLFRAVWKWKYLIICGVFVFALGSFLISSILPKIYRIETLIRPGILSLSENGKNIYLDTPENIKAIIEAGTFDSPILSDLEKSFGSNAPKILRFKVTLPRNSNSLKISYETMNVEQGIEILGVLGKLLTEEYGSYVKFFQKEIDKNLNVAQAEIEKNRSMKRSNEINIKNIEKRIYELEAGIEFVNENTAYLHKERTKLLAKQNDESNILTTILYSNTIQQNLQLENEYKNEIKNLQLEKETELQNISELENKIQMQIAEIDNLEFKKSNIQNIRIVREPYSTNQPIKPKKTLNVIFATLTGAFLMVFISFFLEYISKHKNELTDKNSSR